MATIDYAKMFKKTIVHTVDLWDPETLAKYKSEGFCWIRPRWRSFDLSLRNPVIGCYVELLVHEDVGCAYIDSRVAKKLIRRVCPGPL